MSSRAYFRELAQSIVRDDVGALTLDDSEDALQDAVSHYSRFRPRRFVEDLTAVADKVLTRDVAGDLSDWDESSAVESIEYPAGLVPPSIEAHQTYLAPGGALSLYVEELPQGETARVTYTARHLVAASTCTVPQSDYEAVGSWMAARLLEELAARGAAVTDSTMAADSVERNSQSRDYRALAKGYRDRFYELLGIDRRDQMRTPGASATATMGQRRLSVGTRRITHGRHRLDELGAGTRGGGASGGGPSGGGDQGATTTLRAGWSADASPSAGELTASSTGDTVTIPDGAGSLHLLLWRSDAAGGDPSDIRIAGSPNWRNLFGSAIPLADTDGIGGEALVTLGTQKAALLSGETARVT